MARFLTPLPEGLRFTDPAVTVATFGGSGLLRPAPGTWGSLAALFAGWAVVLAGGPVLLTILALGAFLAGLWATEQYAEAAGRPDPSEVVIDEVAAMWLVMAALPPTLVAYALGFFFFRLFDIWKPWPIRAIERRVGGEMGVMADDIAAAIYAIIAAWAAGLYLLSI